MLKIVSYPHCYLKAKKKKKETQMLDKSMDSLLRHWTYSPLTYKTITFKFKKKKKNCHRITYYGYAYIRVIKQTQP